MVDGKCILWPSNCHLDDHRVDHGVHSDHHINRSKKLKNTLMGLVIFTFSQLIGLFISGLVLGTESYIFQFFIGLAIFTTFLWLPVWITGAFSVVEKHKMAAEHYKRLSIEKELQEQPWYDSEFHVD